MLPEREARACNTTATTQRRSWGNAERGENRRNRRAGPFGPLSPKEARKPQIPNNPTAYSMQGRPVLTRQLVFWSFCPFYWLRGLIIPISEFGLEPCTRSDQTDWSDPASKCEYLLFFFSLFFLLIRSLPFEGGFCWCRS
ncbi:hypothetical protein F4820DRAFT_266826 [Hypoxylon rubiginosum]|uniref:Uncharacterized protein n=1 Tax=Hypoxylon rubiginosum TaxID=110542 RepID=A0ACB9Z4A3_9PEZI|nr:hypothetical protein F4820DRAFT_266826 [Hypoxylon rubiginosum]